MGDGYTSIPRVELLAVRVLDPAVLGVEVQPGSGKPVWRRARSLGNWASVQTCWDVGADISDYIERFYNPEEKTATTRNA